MRKLWATTWLPVLVTYLGWSSFAMPASLQALARGVNIPHYLVNSAVDHNRRR